MNLIFYQIILQIFWLENKDDEEKIVYFSTLNSQDKLDQEGEDNLWYKLSTLIFHRNEDEDQKEVIENIDQLEIEDEKDSLKGKIYIISHNI
jgi:hypothetical protein